MTSKPLELELLRVEFRQIKAIDQINQTFSLRLWLQFHIKLEPLEEKVRAELLDGLKDKNDTPPFKSARWYAGNLQWHNASSEPQMVSKQIDQIGNAINIVFEVEGSFVELFELKHFPFDHQSVTAKLRIQCALEGKVPVVFTGLHTAVEVVDVENFSLQNTWDIEKRLEVHCESVSPMEGRTYPLLKFTAHVNRKPWFYVWNVIVPMSMLSLAAFLQFEVAESDVADRASISLTLLLTAVAYKLVTAGMVPAISYFTLLDKFVAANIILMLGLVLESGATNELVTNGWLGWRPKNERFSIQVCFSVWVAIHVWFIIDARMTHRKAMKEAKGREEEYNLEEKSRKSNYQDMLRNTLGVRSSPKLTVPPGRPPTRAPAHHPTEQL